MSDYESHIGKLRKVDLKGKTKEQFFEDKCLLESIDNDGYDSWEEAWKSETDDYYAYFAGKEDVWEVFDHVQPDSFDGFHITDNKDGTYSFTTTFYNGGTCLSEIIEEEIAKL